MVLAAGSGIPSRHHGERIPMVTRVELGTLRRQGKNAEVLLWVGGPPLSGCRPPWQGGGESVPNRHVCARPGSLG